VEAHVTEPDPVADLVGIIKLGYEVEADDPNMPFPMPSDREIEWLAASIVSEGWGRRRP
jgi:hypothetical protein